MATLLEDYVGALKRATAPIGQFAELFPESTDFELAEVMLDAFGMAQLDGFLRDFEADEDGEVTPDLSRGQGALLVMYATRQLLVNEIRNRKTRTRYEAGPVKAEEEQGASVLVKLLDDLNERFKDLLAEARRGSHVTAVYMVDQYFVRATNHYSPVHIGLEYYDPYGR